MTASDDTTNQPVKRCFKCGEEKPATFEHFYRDKRAPSGLRSDCKRCNNLRHEDWRSENRDKVNERNRNSYYRNIEVRRASQKRYASEHPEKARERTKRFYIRHHDRLLEKRRNDYHINKAKHLAYAKKWRDANREKLRAFWARRRFILRNGGVPFTAEDVRIQFKMQKGNCWWCGNHITGKWEVDHRIPVSRGGMNTNRDIVVACRRCNRSKKDKMPWEWIGRLL